MTFDKVSKKKATDLTPEGAKIELDVSKMVDPVTKKDVFIAPDGYDGSKDDDAHNASDVKPSVTVSASLTSPSDPNTYTVTVAVTPGSPFSVTDVQVSIGGTVVKTLTGSGSFSYVVQKSDSSKTLSATVTDSGFYTGTGTGTDIPKYDNSGTPKP